MDNKIQTEPKAINIKKPKSRNQTLYIILTIVIVAVFCVLKMFAFGWYTIMLFLPMVAYLVFYINYGNMIAKKPVKAIDDYLYFWLVSVFLLLFALFFVDAGDHGPTVKILKFIPDNISIILSLTSAFFSVFFMVIFVTSNKKQQKGLN